MNTKLIMTTNALFLGSIGIMLSFASDHILQSMELTPNQPTVLIMQTLGAFYVAFAILNWMTKNGLIGGIYNRPIAMANFTHYMIAGLALVKSVFANPALPLVIWVAAGIYTCFGVLYGVILFRHPVKVS